jgi:hypothetical protein
VFCPTRCSQERAVDASPRVRIGATAGGGHNPGMSTDDERHAPSPRPLIYRRAYDLAREAIDEQDAGEAGADPSGLMRRLVAEVLAELGDHAEAREAIEDGVSDAVGGRPPRS